MTRLASSKSQFSAEHLPTHSFKFLSLSFTKLWFFSLQYFESFWFFLDSFSLCHSPETDSGRKAIGNHRAYCMFPLCSGSHSSVACHLTFEISHSMYCCLVFYLLMVRSPNPITSLWPIMEVWHLIIAYFIMHLKNIYVIPVKAHKYKWLKN
jgi:hypothetical protein